jgi:hypothetical protein
MGLLVAEPLRQQLAHFLFEGDGGVKNKVFPQKRIYNFIPIL